MAEMIRNPDYLKRHLDVRDRVRNLETGVHFLGSELRYYDTIFPTNINLLASASWKLYESGVFSWPPKWQRRTGLVILSGAVQLKVGVSNPPADQQIATLPVEARPLVAMTIQVTSETSPYRTRIKVAEDGTLRLLADGLVGTEVIVWFDGATWAVN
jgi:hypothetical protein